MDEPPPGPGHDGSLSNGGSWAGATATPNQAMDWGIDLCGQLATLHHEGVVVGRIMPETIRRGRFGQPQLPEPDPDTAAAPQDDVAALAHAIGVIVADPPAELRRALEAPAASAVELGQHLQAGQRGMGLPVAPIPFHDAPTASVGGTPPEVPPDTDDRGEETPSLPADAAMDVDLDFDPAELAQNPNMRVLLLIAVVVAVLAVVVGVGWR